MYSKQSVGFEHPAKGPNHCGACQHFRDGRCEIVSGSVLAEDWCRKFKGSMLTTKSPAEINKGQSCDAECGRKEADARSNHPGTGILEHGLHVTSRTMGKSVEVTFGPQGGSLVPANPFASLAQAGYLHSHPEILGKSGLDEWDSATKGKKLPKRVKRKK
jgi:hypothetical protein